jgi:hypothetical protein
MFKKKVPEQPLEFIMLDQEDFTCLVRGGVLHVGNLRIALKDIGFHVMDEAITKADNGIDHYKDHVKVRNCIV